MKLALLCQSPEGTPHMAHSFIDTHTPLRCESWFQPGSPHLLCSHLQPTVSVHIRLTAIYSWLSVHIRLTIVIMRLPDARSK